MPACTCVSTCTVYGVYIGCVFIYVHIQSVYTFLYGDVDTSVPRKQCRIMNARSCLRLRGLQPFGILDPMFLLLYLDLHHLIEIAHGERSNVNPACELQCLRLHEPVCMPCIYMRMMLVAHVDPDMSHASAKHAVKLAQPSRMHSYTNMLCKLSRT